MAGRFQRRLARANRRPWLLATGEEYRYPSAEGPRPGWVTRQAHRHLDRLLALATYNPAVRRRFVEVIHLVRLPASLFAPGLVLRAALARFAAPRLA